MFKTLKKTMMTFLAAGLLAVPAMAGAQAAAVGEAAPDFTLTDTHGNEHSLSDFAGQVVVLEWFNHECPFVVKFYDSGKMQELQRSAAEDGIVWLTVVSSAPGTQGYTSADEANEIIANWESAEAARLLDPEGTAGRLYDARTTPHMYIIDTEGTLVYNGAIDSIASANQDDIEKADNYVVNALEALAAGAPIEPNQTRPYGCSVKYN